MISQSAGDSQKYIDQTNVHVRFLCTATHVMISHSDMWLFLPLGMLQLFRKMCIYLSWRSSTIYLLWIMWMNTQVETVQVEDILLSVQDDGDSGSEFVTFLSIFRLKKGFKWHVSHWGSLSSVGKKAQAWVKLPFFVGSIEIDGTSCARTSELHSSLSNLSPTPSKNKCDSKNCQGPFGASVLQPMRYYDIFVLSVFRYLIF